jgi:hypothetical protein
LVAFNKFNGFTDKLVKGVHNFNVNTIKVALYVRGAPTPPVAGDLLYAATLAVGGAVEVGAGNGYTTGGNSGGAAIATNAAGTETVKTTTAIAQWIASAAGFSHQYVVAYDFTTANKDLIGWWDYGSSLTLNGPNGDTYDVTGLNTALFTLV